MVASWTLQPRLHRDGRRRRLLRARRAARRRGTHDPRQRAQLRRARGAPPHRGLSRPRGVPARAHPAHGRAGPLRRQSEGLRLRRPLERRLRPHHAGARGGRLRAALDGLGAGLALDVRHLALGHRGAQAALAPRDGGGTRHRLLRPDRARSRLGSRRHGDAGASRRQRLDTQRYQALDHERLGLRHRDRVGEGRRGDPRLPGRSRDARASRPATSRGSSRCARRSRRS